MNKTKIIVAIVSAALTAGLGVAVSIFPNITTILVALIGLISAVSNTINGANNS